MRLCRVVDFLFGAVPTARWRAYLVRLHYDRCPTCRPRLAGPEEVRRLLVGESELGEVPDFWPAVERRLKEKADFRRPAAARLYWRAAGVVAAILLVVVALDLWVLRRASRPMPALSAAGEVFNLLSVQVDESPASAFVFQPGDSPLVLVWVERSP